MTDAQERRDPATGRMPVSTLVEVCGNIPGIPVFEAESLDVSPRGMHLRTAYLPEDGAPLVCRFESEGREIVVEGVVAWRREAGRGGEFGVKFTALDSRSVDALRHLCAAEAGKDEHGEGEPGRVSEPGSRVRLHIEGLGSPMKARVKTGSSGRVQVGSSLEFLKVGRRLEIEDLERGGRRSAEIDGVSVMVDPSTQVPQLVVALRFEGAEDSTPSPSVADLGTKDRPAPALRIPGSAVSTDAGPCTAKVSQSETSRADAARADDDDGDEPDPEMRGPVASFAASAEKKAIRAGEKLAQASGIAAKNAQAWFKGAAVKLSELRRSGKPARRTTSPAPGAFSAEKQRLRPQSGASPSSAPDKAPPRLSRRNVGIAAGSAVLGTAALVFALRGPSVPPPGAASSSDTANSTAAGTPTPSGSGAVLGQGASTAASSRANGAVTANVPLFGPTPLTTTEPAPLGPPPGSDAKNLEESEKAEAKASLGSRADDESFGEESGTSNKSPSAKSDKPSAKPEDVRPWGHGRMHEPVIYRLRLDGAGAALQGAVEPTGFTVVIPSRKVMETTAQISKRDARVARVKATNTGSGAQVSFRFKESVPSYRVRLRRDYVEFLISSETERAAESKPAPKRKASSSEAKSSPRER